MYYYKRNASVSLFSMLSAGIAIITNVLLIEPYGYLGAAFATSISYFSLFILGLVNVTKKLKIEVFDKKEIIILQIMLLLPVIVKILLGSV
jgi:O-antigen/teichoic acid export membrane protein